MAELTRELSDKLEQLKEYFIKLNKVAIAFSGGVDSTFLLKVAKEVIPEGVIAITAKSCLIPEREMDESYMFCLEEGINQVVIEENPFEVENFSGNPKDRCYICKKHIFTDIIKTAREYGINYVAEGSNLDDLGDYRPGLKAIEELKIKSPLRECGFTKAEIRAISAYYGLKTSTKPSYACLASRFVYGEEITEAKLKMVELAEGLLLSMDFSGMRVRIHGLLARIEVPEHDIERLVKKEVRERIVSELKKLGFTYVSMDLQGYRTGSMNIDI